MEHKPISVDTYDNIIDDEVCALLDSSYLFNKTNSNPSIIIDRDNPLDLIEQILCVISYTLTDTKKRYMEVWTQKTSFLDPHCDFNYLHNSVGTNLVGVPEDQFLSPVTIALYTNTNDLVGGDLILTGRSWREEMPNPLGKKIDDMLPYVFMSISPKVRSAVLFQGSEYYHWISPIEKGTRHSILMNFWDYPLYSS